MMQRLAGASREDRLLLVGLPVFTILLLIGWIIWREVASLDNIEISRLTWPYICTLSRQLLLIVFVGTCIVLDTAFPTGILLTCRGTGFLTPVVLSITNAAQSAPVFGVIVILALANGFGV